MSELTDGFIRPDLASSLEDDYTLSEPEQLVRVKDFFKGQNVFITGGTGFMGKVLIEKLLWSCEDVGNVYVMLRAKKGMGVQERLNKMLESEIFDRIRNRGDIKKLIAIEGDVMQKNLNISDEDVETLHNEVSVVFHAAATVRFEEPLDRAIITNVRGTRDVLELSKGMKKLKSFVHVSTTYANSDKKVIGERVYTKDANWKMYIELAETLKHDMNSLRHKLIERHPNIYTFTKYLAENVVNDYRCDVPVIMFRPSIVSFCLKDPLPGWAGNFNGPIGIWTGVITGVIHVMLCKSSGINDYIPCDYAINALILSAWYRGMQNTQKCVTINAAAGDTMKICPEVLFDLAYTALEKYPPEKMLQFPTFRGITNYYLYIFMFVVKQIIPGLLFDILFAIKGIPFRILPIYRKIYSLNNVLYFFVINEWEITMDNYYKLNEFMHPDDREIYLLDLTKANVVDSSYIMIEGFKKYILKENFDEESIKKARKNFVRMYIIDCVLKALLLSFMCWLLYKLVLYGYSFITNFQL